MTQKDKAGCPGPKLQTTRLARISARLDRLKLEFTQTRARQLEETQRQAKLARIRDRQNGERELRQLGLLCRIAGLSDFRVSTGEVLPDQGDALDADLIVGSLKLLHDQLGSLGSGDLDKLRHEGQQLRRAHSATTRGRQAETEQ